MVAVRLAAVLLLAVVSHGAGVALANDDLALARGNGLLKDLEKFSHDTRPVLNIAPGEYLIPASNRPFHLVLRGLKGKKVSGRGARLLFSDPQKGGVLISGADGLTLEGVEFDWAVKPFAVGQVKGIDGDGSGTTIQLVLRPEFARSVPHLSLAKDVWATVHDGKGKRRLQPSRDVVWVKPASADTAGNLTVSVAPQSLKVARSMEVGDWLVIVARYDGTHAVLIDDSRTVTLQNVTIRSSPAMGILAMPSSSNITIQNCIVQGTGPYGWISTNSDGIHLMGIGGATVIRNTVVDGAQDDALVVSERGGWGKVVGDRIEFRGDATNKLADARDFFLVTQTNEMRLIAAPVTRRTDGVTEILLHGQPIEVAEGGAVAVFRNPEAKSTVLLEGNKISNIRGTGIRICRSNVIAKGNVIDLTVNWAITAGPYLYSVWHPQMPATDVQIVQNTIRQPSLSPNVRDLRGTVEVSCLPLAWCANRNLNKNVRLEGNKYEGGTGYARQREFILLDK